MGSGPHDTARSTLVDYFTLVECHEHDKAVEITETMEHMFCENFISLLQDGWNIWNSAITTWLTARQTRDREGSNGKSLSELRGVRVTTCGPVSVDGQF
jgi:hypothetical protein